MIISDGQKMQQEYQTKFEMYFTQYLKNASAMV